MTRAELGQDVLTEYRDRFGEDYDAYAFLIHVIQRALDFREPEERPPTN